MKIDKKVIKELSDYLDEFNLTEIEITEKDTKIKVSKNNISINSQPQIVSSSTASNKEVSYDSKKIVNGKEITSPIIGEVTSVPELTFLLISFVLFDKFCDDVID